MTIVALFIVFAAVIGSSTMVAIIAYFLNRLRQIESGGGTEVGSRQLVEQVNRVREELITVQEEMASLTERLDFTENLLMSGNKSDTPEGSE